MTGAKGASRSVIRMGSLASRITRPLSQIFLPLHGRSGRDNMTPMLSGKGLPLGYAPRATTMPSGIITTARKLPLRRHSLYRSLGSCLARLALKHEVSAMQLMHHELRQRVDCEKPAARPLLRAQRLTAQSHSPHMFGEFGKEDLALFQTRAQVACLCLIASPPIASSGHVRLPREIDLTSSTLHTLRMVVVGGGTRS